MAYIIVTTDKDAIIWKKHHSECVGNDVEALANFLNELSSAVLRAETYFEELRAKQREILGT